MFWAIRKLFRVFSSSDSYRPRRGQPTQRQLEYLDALIEKNNQYRATPWSLQDWVGMYLKGQWDRGRAAKLIEKLKEENSEKARIFADKIQGSHDQRQRRVLHASDFSSYGFCANAFYLKFRGYVNRNLYELDQGHYFHGEFAESKGYSNQNSEAIRSHIRGIREIKWFKLNETEALHEPELRLAGIPDGIICFKDGGFSVVEVKSTRLTSLETPYWGDLMQVCAYRRICESGKKEWGIRVDPRMFILYVGRESGKRMLFEADYRNYRDRFHAMYDKMKDVEFQSELYQSPKNRKKCASCGYRTVCASWVER